MVACTMLGGTACLIRSIRVSGVVTSRELRASSDWNNIDCNTFSNLVILIYYSVRTLSSRSYLAYIYSNQNVNILYINILHTYNIQVPKLYLINNFDRIYIKISRSTVNFTFFCPDTPGWMVMTRIIPKTTATKVVVR